MAGGSLVGGLVLYDEDNNIPLLESHGRSQHQPPYLLLHFISKKIINLASFDQNLDKLKMFDLRSGDELSFVTKSISRQEDNLSFYDLISDQASLGCNVHPTTATATSSTTIATQKQRFIEFGVQESKTEKKNELGIHIRKNDRRDVEKRRRNEMANLYASLRTLLPFECTKGKRSISDHIHEAVNYIKHKKKNIQDLKIRRDQLQELSYISENSKHSVTVNVETRGVEILIHSCLKNRSFRISTVFVEITEWGLDVVAWVTTTVNGKFFHKIQAEVLS